MFAIELCSETNITKFKRVNLSTEIGKSIARKHVKENPDYVIIDYKNTIDYDVDIKEDIETLIRISDKLKEKEIESLEELYRDINFVDAIVEEKIKKLGLKKSKEYIFDNWKSENIGGLDVSIKNETLTGTSLSGTSMSRERVGNDYYATPPESTIALLEREKFFGGILEQIGRAHV